MTDPCNKTTGAKLVIAAWFIPVATAWALGVSWGWLMRKSRRVGLHIAWVIRDPYDITWNKELADKLASGDK